MRLSAAHTMFKLIERMRRKPEGERQRLVFLVSASFTLVVMVFWGFALVYRINTGGLSFKFDASQMASVRNMGAQIGESFDRFFPSEKSVVATSSSDGADLDDSAATAEGRYPALEVLLGEPEIVDEEQEAYPADIYSN